MATGSRDTDSPIATYLLNELTEMDGVVVTVSADMTATEAKVEALKDHARRLRDALRCLGHEAPAPLEAG